MPTVPVVTPESSAWPSDAWATSGEQAILEFVGVRDRVVQRSEKPAFEDTPEVAEEEPVADEAAEETEAGDTEVDQEETAEAADEESKE